MNLHAWLRRRPVPHAVMCDDTRILIGDNRRRWADCIEAIFATSAENISAVDAKGAVLRVCSRADVDDAPGTEPPADGITETQKDLAQVAQIIAEAYSTAHDHARENSARGYELLAKFAELSFGRLAAIERAYGQLLAAHARAIDSQGSDGLDGMINGIIGKAMGSKGNGRADAKPETEPAP